MHKSGKRKPGRYDLRFCIQLALAACISFCTKITVRFKVFFETDGMNDELDFEILSIGTGSLKRKFLRLNPFTEYASRAAVYTTAHFALQNACWETPKPADCIHWMQSARLHR